MCRNGFYTECGIKQRHGYAQEQFRLDPEFAVPVDGAGRPRCSGRAGVGRCQGWDHCLHFLQRTDVSPRTALITGAGPIGLLAALATSQYGLDTYVVDIVDSGPKPDLVRSWERLITPVRSTTRRSRRRS